MLATLTQAWQSWRFARSVLVLAATALAIGIGATTAVYTVVNAVMVRPLTYEQGDRFVVLFGASIGDAKGRSSLAFEDVVRYQQETQSFDVFGWYRPETYTLTRPGPPRHVEGAAVTTSLAHQVGVSPMVGRWFYDAGEAVISSALWAELGGSSDLLGNPIVLNGHPFVVTGVMPPRFRLPEIGHGGNNVRNDVWIPLDATGRAPGSREGGFFFVYARLKPDVTIAQADADVKRVAAAIAAAEPRSHPGYTARLYSLRGLVIEGIRPTLLVLLAAAALLFLVGCANAAALLLARSVARLRETAVRVALGASRGRLARQFFAEGLIVGLIGSVVGILLSVTLVKLVVTMAAEFVPRAEEVTIDWRVLAFTLIVGVLASAISCLAPLWQATRTQPSEVLADGVRSTPSAHGRRLSGSLVVAELGMAFTLLSVGVMLVLHVRQLLHVPAGFDADHLFVFQITLPDEIIGDARRRVQQQIRFVDALKALPGVQGVGLSNQTPLGGCCLSTALFPEGEPANLSIPQKVSFLPVNPGYFDTLRMPLLRGRLFTYADSGDTPLRVVINQAAARRYWPRRDALDAFGRLSTPDGARFQVMGVVGDVRNDGLDKPTVPEVYLLHSVAAANPTHFVVRSTLPPQTLLPEIHHAILSVDTAQPIHDEATLDQVVVGSLALQRVAMTLTGFFAIAALVMAALGAYGVMSYSVRQRTVEFGTRMALGAVGRDLLALVLGGGLRIAAAGILLGALTVIVVTRWLAPVLELPRMGSAPFASAVVMIGVLALVASLVPAWRASQMTPLLALRNDTGALQDASERQLRMPSIWRRLSQRFSRRVSSLGSAKTERELPSAGIFVEAARTASSTSEALQLALSALAGKLGAAWVMLLEAVDGKRVRVQRVSADGEVTHSELPASGFLVNRLQYHDGALPISTADLNSWLDWASEYRKWHVPEIEALREAGARLAIGLRTQRTVSAVLVLGAPAGRDAYTNAERQALRESASQLALMLENTRLTTRIVEQEVLRRDLALAAEVQRRLLPEAPPEASVVSLAAFTSAARNVAGDYYDFMRAGDHYLGVALADVSGKGVAAALIMSIVQASLRLIASDDRVPPRVLAARMNDLLYRSTRQNSYATLFFTRVDERTKEMEYVNAGHNPPYLVRPVLNGGAPTITELHTGGMVLGLFPDIEYEQAPVALQSDDVLFIYTDGVTESLSVDDIEFGEERLRQLLVAHHHLPAQALADVVADTLRSWAAGATPHDDVTFVVMRVA